MIDHMPKLSVKQRLRLRELAKYYCAALPNGIGRSVADTPLANVNNDFELSKPRLAEDANLTALAQLAALRTGCQRAYFSIIDQHAQHVIAEATRSHSVYDFANHDPGDALIFGVQSLPRSYTICAQALDLFSIKPDFVCSEPSNLATSDYVVISDLQVERKTKDTPVVKLFPDVLRYHVEVPLRSKSGFVLGSICVADSRPRQPDLTHIRILQEVARLVMDHLESSRMKEDHRRAERLLSGLSHFVQGRDSISKWSEGAPGQELVPSVESQHLRPSMTTLGSLSRATSRHQSPTGRLTDLKLQANGVPKPRSPISICLHLNDNCSPATTSQESLPAQDCEIGFDAPDELENAQAAAVAAKTATSLRRVFARASNLIRESMDLDAATFLEVPHNERFKSAHRSADRADGSSDKQHTSTSDSDFSVDSLNEPRQQQNTGSSREKVFCHRLGFSTRLRSSLIGSVASEAQLTVSPALLSRLSSKYPDGHIFNFDAAGGISSGDDEELTAESQTSAFSPANKQLSARLHRMFPTARSLLFLPLYDNDKQQIYAGFIGISTDPTRALQKYESVYVSAFTNSLMCEVMRLEALALDKAKSDFISSISHELRSPLHGILASAQLLAEANIQPVQIEFVQMIDTCARTLLDIMNHLLDHAKINHFTKQDQGESKKSEKGINFEAESLVESVNLLSIVEETTSSMVASGIQMRQAQRRAEDQRPPLARSHTSGDVTRVSMPIILRIAPCKQWDFATEAGSWRRIIMNLIGNSLKYTKKGHITVELAVHPRSNGKYMAVLKITDTGQGISADYLKHRLYTPYAQENNLSVGTGLGLSLVRQIVTALHGEIHIQSEKNIGTQITVEIPVYAAQQSADIEIVNGMSHLTMSQPRSFAFSGFRQVQLASSKLAGASTSRLKALQIMKESLSELLITWFGCQIVKDEPDITIVEESHLDYKLSELDHPGKKLIIIGLDGRRATFANTIRNASYVYLLPPVGPTRMAEAVEALFNPCNVATPAGSERPYDSFSEPPETPQEYNAPPTPPSEPQRLSPLSIAPELIESSSSSTTLAVADAQKEAILLVDDNDINLRILYTTVTRLNLSAITVLTATNGKEALDAYISAIDSGIRVSVIFMDISMPVMDGFQATREIRSFEKKKDNIMDGRKAHIVALTGLASADARNEVVASGFDSYLGKPVNLKIMREMLAIGRSPKGDQSSIKDGHRPETLPTSNGEPEMRNDHLQNELTNDRADT